MRGARAARQLAGRYTTCVTSEVPREETCSNAIDPTFNLSHGLFNTAIIKATMAKNGKITCYEWAGAPVPSATAPR